MTPTDRATRAAEALKDKFAISRYDRIEVRATDAEIASILRPFMETREEPNSMWRLLRPWMDIIGPGDEAYTSNKWHPVFPLTLNMIYQGTYPIRRQIKDLLEESKRKDELIRKALRYAEYSNVTGISPMTIAANMGEVEKILWQAMNPPDDGKTLERGEM